VRENRAFATYVYVCTSRMYTYYIYSIQMYDVRVSNIHSND